MASQNTPLPGGEFIKIRVAPEQLLAKMRNIRGQFTNSQTALRNAHERLGLAAQQDMQAVLIEQVGHTGRPQKSGKELINALVDGRLVILRNQGFAVDGNRLDEIEAVRPYWKRLEEGELGDNGKGMYMKWVWGYWSGPGTADNGTPEKGRRISGHYRSNLHMRFKRATPGAKGAFQITKPIPQYHFMHEGWRRFQRRRNLRADIYINEFGSIGIPLTRAGARDHP